MESKMSSRLEQLVNSLSDIILEYCDMPTEAPSFVLLSDKASSTEENLTEQIHQFNKNTDLMELIANMENNPHKQHRQSLMEYLFYGIKLLQPIVNNQFPLNERDATNLQKPLVALIDNLRILLNTSKTMSISVATNNDARLDIYGYNDCNAGRIIRENLFTPLKIPVTAANEDIQQFIKDLFNEHQCSRLYLDNERLQHNNLASIQENIKLFTENEALKESNEHLKAELKSLTRTYKEKWADLVETFQAEIDAQSRQRTDSKSQAFSSEKAPNYISNLGVFSYFNIAAKAFFFENNDSDTETEKNDSEKDDLEIDEAQRNNDDYSDFILNV